MFSTVDLLGLTDLEKMLLILQTFLSVLP